jgi:3-hydroxybutyryl-CoA dehydrogenase
MRAMAASASDGARHRQAFSRGSHLTSQAGKKSVFPVTYYTRKRRLARGIRMPIEKVGVVGCGLMGSGIAQVAAQAGFTVTVREVSTQLVDKGLQSIEKNLARLVEKGALSSADRDLVRARLRGTTNLEDLNDSSFIIEAIVEQLPAKRELWSSLDKLCPKTTIFASNTSSLSITEMATFTLRPERFLGLHFFNPVPVMKLVEVIRTISTDSKVFDEVLAFALKLGKTPVRTTDRTGFIVNRLLVPYILDAVRALEEGVGSIEDIDNSMKLGCGHPMGPLTLLDFVGLDTTYYIANIMFDEFKERRFAPPPLLKRMVLAGWHGRKTGRGFYDYGDPAKPKPIQLT